MAVFYVLLLALAAVNAAPISSEANTTETVIIEELVVDLVPAVIALDLEGSTTEEPDHKIEKRSILREDFVGSDIIADFEGSKLENQLTGLDRRIKTLPSWVG